jgi:hypothetical protein
MNRKAITAFVVSVLAAVATVVGIRKRRGR